MNSRYTIPVMTIGLVMNSYVFMLYVAVAAAFFRGVVDRYDGLLLEIPGHPGTHTQPSLGRTQMFIYFSLLEGSRPSSEV